MVQNSRPPIDAGAIPKSKRSESVTAGEHLSSYNLKPPPEPSRNLQQTETTKLKLLGKEGLCQIPKIAGLSWSCYPNLWPRRGRGCADTDLAMPVLRWWGSTCGLQDSTKYDHADLRVCLKMLGIFPMIASHFSERDNDQQNHWVQWGTQHFQTHPFEWRPTLLYATGS